VDEGRTIDDEADWEDVDESVNEGSDIEPEWRPTEDTDESVNEGSDIEPEWRPTEDTDESVNEGSDIEPERRPTGDTEDEGRTIDVDGGRATIDQERDTQGDGDFDPDDEEGWGGFEDTGDEGWGGIREDEESVEDPSRDDSDSDVENPSRGDSDSNEIGPEFSFGDKRLVSNAEVYNHSTENSSQQCRTRSSKTSLTVLLCVRQLPCVCVPGY
jgi:hypothetical protein